MAELDEKALGKHVKAGKILKEVQKNARKSIKTGHKLLEIAERIEQDIANIGAEEAGKGEKTGAAFPVNLSINHNAAHYTPSFGDETVLGEKDVLKVDIGVHVDGYIADAAFTLDFSGGHGKMVEAAENALEAALAIAKQGAKLGKIGGAIQREIAKAGFRPIQNLSGHGLGRWRAHAQPTVPNIANRDERTLDDGMVIAIEPFATDGNGLVKEAPQSEIFQLDEPKPVRGIEARRIMEFVKENFETLPFAERWIISSLKMGEFARRAAMRELLLRKCIKAFPILHEQPGKFVAQAETSIALQGGKVTILV